MNIKTLTKELSDYNIIGMNKAMLRDWPKDARLCNVIEDNSDILDDIAEYNIDNNPIYIYLNLRTFKASVIYCGNVLLYMKIVNFKDFVDKINENNVFAKGYMLDIGGIRKITKNDAQNRRLGLD